MKFTAKLALLFIGLAVIISACSTTQAATSKQVEVTMVSHAAAGLPEQDAFVEVAPGQVKRLAADEIETYREAPVFTTQEMVAHDPFEVGDNPLGPYPQGQPLGFTMADWLAATGAGTYTISGDQAEIDLHFENLVPNGIYTVWCAYVTVPPEPNIIDEPCGKADGSENIFIAGADGTAEFHLTQGVLPDSDGKTFTTLAIAYHSDGKTYGPYPGDFGKNSHVQAMYMIPTPEDTAWQTNTTDNAVVQR